jgi:putative membrane protein
VAREDVEFRALIGVTLAALVLSATGPSDPVTWFLEAVPVMIGIPLLIATRHGFPLTPLLMRLLVFHAGVLLLGAYYTYAKVPLGFWAAEMFDFSRNHYDRFAHVVQGAVPAILAREILLRKTPLRPGGWLFVLVTCVCLAFSAFYEMIEWWSALIGGQGADAFLGAQGDIWDSHWDMFLALVGAIAAQLTFSRAHDRALARRPMQLRNTHPVKSPESGTFTPNTN